MARPDLFSQMPLQVLKTSILSSVPPHMYWRDRDKEGGLERSAGNENTEARGVRVATREVPCLQGPNFP